MEETTSRRASSNKDMDLSVLDTSTPQPHRRREPGELAMEGSMRELLRSEHSRGPVDHSSYSSLNMSQSQQQEPDQTHSHPTLVRRAASDPSEFHHSLNNLDGSETSLAREKAMMRYPASRAPPPPPTARTTSTSTGQRGLRRTETGERRMYRAKPPPPAALLAGGEVQRRTQEPVPPAVNMDGSSSQQQQQEQQEEDQDATASVSAEQILDLTSQSSHMLSSSQQDPSASTGLQEEQILELTALSSHAQSSHKQRTIHTPAATFCGTTPPPPTLHSMESGVLTKIQLARVLPTITDEQAVEEMGQQQREWQRRQQQQQQQRQQQQPLACGSCDDCLKGLPCLVASLDGAAPGAFSVTAEAEVRRTPACALTTDPDSRQRESLQQYSPTTSSPTTRRQSSNNLAVAQAVSAQLVECGEEEARELTQREHELQEREEQLAEQLRQLQALQEQLELQRLQLAGGNNATPLPTTTVTAQVVVAVPEEKPPATRPSATARAMIEPRRSHAKFSNATSSGPMRFAPPGGADARQVLMGVDSQMQLALRELQQKWRDRQDKLASKYSSGGKKQRLLLFDLTPQWHLRYLWAYAKQNKLYGSYQFPLERTFAAEKKLQKRFFSLNMNRMREQIRSKTLFPVPGLKTQGGHDMFYMRPSRYLPGQTATKTVIDNLIYVMNTMLENNLSAQKEGIGFVACMDEWKMKNFEVSYCYQFMMGLQGVMVPVKTQLFLIVNPPSWFGAIWKIMRPMLAPSFRKRVKICPESKISKYLQPGFEKFLPDDMQTGQADTDAMVRDFIAYRDHVEPGQNARQQDVDQSSVHGGSSNGDIDDMGSVSVSHHNSSSDGCSLYGSQPSIRSSEHGDEDDDASIHGDIDNYEALEEEDMKQQSTEVVRISNMPRP
ncbi:expressed unknown protein [Seminavis robusta]|uniref:CRAL-TRIO domain-containing protein n=1 Tax=Seminavis robusta TaxID=568900 RepID=A0A9N8HJW4_9STRA|nr:expressed unknown protein [Seminavis robusta]|eukprot:Sro794_g203400.1 n/a (894) ;mRNA; r:20010-22782